MQSNLFNLASLTVSSFKRHVLFRKLKLCVLVFFYRPAEAAALRGPPEQLEMAAGGGGAGEGGELKVCGALRRRRKEEAGRKPWRRRSVSGVKFSGQISHRATTFPQATLRVVWKFSVARDCQEALHCGPPPPPPWGRMRDESPEMTNLCFVSLEKHSK